MATTGDYEKDLRRKTRKSSQSRCRSRRRWSRSYGFKSAIQSIESDYDTAEDFGEALWWESTYQAGMLMVVL